MRKVSMVAMAVLMAVGATYAQSIVTYTVEMGGDNHVASYEVPAVSRVVPAYTSGASTSVEQGKDITWAVKIAVDGIQSGGGTGSGALTWGAANMVFDLLLYDANGSLVTTFGAAPMTCTSGSAGVTGALGCKPSAAGFWSNMNDGDCDGFGTTGVDKWENAALAYASAGAPTSYRLIDAPNGWTPDPAYGPTPVGGPGIDYGWFPTTNGRGGQDFAGNPTTVVTNVTTVGGKLAGFGAGYKTYDNTKRAGIGLGAGGLGEYDGYGSGAPLFEGQINTTGLALGTYTVVVAPSADGTNVIHGAVVWDSATPNYGGFGSFAVKANSVVGTQATFVVTQPVIPTSVSGRYVFYNQSFYDGNKAAIDAVALAGANNDDADAIDTSKSPLFSGTATFANWTGFAQGINGLIYDITNPTRTPVVSDFTFNSLGRTGTSAASARTPNGFVVQPGVPAAGKTRVIITFASTGGTAPTGTVINTWLKVDIGTGFGATAETHYWGNARCDDNTTQGATIPVNSTDEVDARNNQTGFSTAIVTNKYDYNKDGKVNATDQVLARNSPSGFNTVAIVTK